MSSKRNRIAYSLAAHQHRIDCRLSAAFLGLVAALRAVPAAAPSWWYNVARADAPVHPKGRDAVVAAQLAMQAALDTRDPVVIERTAEAVAGYFDEMKAAALVGYYERVGGSVEGLLSEASRETSEAMHAMTLFALQPTSPSTAEIVARELREALSACRRVLPLVERALFLRPAHPDGSQKYATGARS